MLNITVKDFVCLFIFFGFAGLSIMLFVQNESKKSQIKANQKQIDTLQSKLKTCKSTSNIIHIGKIKGRATAQIEQLQRLQKDTETPNTTACDTLNVVKWFTSLKYKERQFYEKLAQ